MPRSTDPTPLLSEACAFREPDTEERVEAMDTVLRHCLKAADGVAATWMTGMQAFNGGHGECTALLAVMLRVPQDGVVRQEQFVRCLGSVCVGASQAAANKELSGSEDLLSAFREAMEAETDAEKVSRLLETLMYHAVESDKGDLREVTKVVATRMLPANVIP